MTVLKNQKNSELRSLTGDLFNSSPAFLLTTVGNRMSLIAERSIRKTLGLSLTEWRLIQILGHKPATSPSRLVELTGVNKANVSRAAAALEEKGFLLRKPAPNHGRLTQLFLTRKGEKAFTKGNIARVNGEKKLLETFSSSDQKKLITLLQQLMQASDTLLAEEQ